METFIILLVFVGIPLAFVAFVLLAAIHFAKRARQITQAAQKYLNS